MSVPARQKIHAIRLQRRATLAAALLASLFLLSVTPLRSDEPYARTRDYDLLHSKIALRFDVEHKKIIGEVTHSLSILRDATNTVAFDSVNLNIQSVTVNKSTAKFQTTPSQLLVSLPAAAHSGDKFDIDIKYDRKPSKGLYFILPDKDYPDRPTQIWSQGESEDTRYYLPTYDYPNDRLTTETILTVPAAWLTVGNGKLVGTTDAPGGMRTWTWRESVPSSTYLITVVAGEFDEVKDSFHGLPISYYAPKGRRDRLMPNYNRTPAMLDLFNKKIGVDYPWEKYAQVMVDDFVAGGMENSSATTNTATSLRHPKLIPEYPTDEDDLISHELAHQWFGDLVTCKDWGDIWLNEGFATFFEALWTESHYSKEEADYDRWTGMREWFAKSDLYAKPIVRFDFDDSGEFDGNAYGKAGLVLYMLRHQIGETAFWRGVKHYLDVNRGKNVVTADLIRAIEEANHINVDRFFHDWIFGAGAPRFDLAYTYDDPKHQVALKVKQLQKVEGAVGLFQVPVDVEVTTASGPKLYPITVSKDSETFTFPADSVPLMVLFDKGGHILKSADFHKEKKEWLYQLKHATELADRADAVVALSKIKNDDEAVAALGSAVANDKATQLRAIAADSLGHGGSTAAGKQLLASLEANNQPFVRAHIVGALGYFKGDSTISTKLESISREDNSYRARANALQALGRMKSPNAFSVLSAAVTTESPDGFLRDAALRSLGFLGDDKAVPLLREWAAPGKPIPSRNAAIASMARLEKGDKALTQQIAANLSDSHFPVRESALYALGNRGDASAIPALEGMLHSDDLSIEMVPMIKEQIAKLQKQPATKAGPHASSDEDEEQSTKASSGSDRNTVSQRLDRLERLVEEMAERLKSIDSRLPQKKPAD